MDELRQGRFVAKPEFVSSDKQPAFDWMIGQMQERGLAIGNRPPIWVFLSVPPPKDAQVWGMSPPGDDKRLLHLSIPKSRMLISFHWPWAYGFLSAYRYHPYPRFHIMTTDQERQDFEDNFHQLPSEEDCQNSWQKMFDLSVIQQDNFTGWNDKGAGPPPPSEDTYRLQATVPYLLEDDLIDVQANW